MSAIKNLAIIVLGILDMSLLGFIEQGTMASTFTVFVAVMMLLLVADFITGITKAKKRGHKLTSSRAFVSVIKAFVYLTIMILIFSIVSFYKSSLINNAVIAMSALGLIIEAKSIAENLEEIFGVNFPFLDILDPLSSILSALVSKFVSILDDSKEDDIK